MDFKRIVITGAPGTGKTSLINILEQSGFYCFHEIIRSMTLEAKKDKDSGEKRSNPIAFVNDSKSFNEQLLSARVEQFTKASNVGEKTVFYDRGIPDVLAYMDFFNQPYGDTFLDTSLKNKYDQLFILPPWKAIYVQDNERLESYEEALALHECLVNTYKTLGYTIHEVPFGTVKERLSFVLNHIKEQSE